MAREALLRVFLASPSDVAEERDAVDQVVREVNQTLPRSSAARLELVRWETHTVPDIGTDAQDAVNRQVGEEYDIFVGVLWTRFGTPTPRARSGTEEEFQRALALKRRNPATRVLFYFKAADLPNDVDLEQVRLVRQFRGEIQDHGLIRSYKALDEFIANVRMALTRFALGALSAYEPPHGTAVAPATADGPDDEEEEAGLFDLVDLTNESLDAVAKIAAGLSEGLEDLNNRTTRATKELVALDVAQNPEAARGARRIVNSLAEFMSSYAAQLEGQLSPFREANSRAFRGILDLARIAPDFSDSSVQPMRDNVEQVRTLRDAISGARQALGEMRETVQRQPRVTTQFNRSKRRLVNALATLEEEMGSAIASAEEAEMLMIEVIAGLERSEAGS